MTDVHVDYAPRGAVREAILCHDPQILIDGPAGTGKTRGILEAMHAIAVGFPNSKQLICRRTMTALTDAALATWRDRVIKNELELGKVSFFGGSRDRPPGFYYENGSFVGIRGLDDVTKTYSTEYDLIYVNEATEVSEGTLEELTRSLRNGVIPHPRLYCDCNPSTDRHYLLKRCNSGQMRRFKSTIKDNPVYWDATLNEYTPEGLRYVEGVLGHMTGTRRQRLYEGTWVGMENAIYPQLDPSVQLQPLPVGTRWETGALGVDFGRVHLSAVVAVSRASDGIVWVRDVWAENGGNLQAIEDATRGMKVRYGIRRGVVDPIQEVLAQRLGFAVAKSGAGSRKQRISWVTKLLDANALKFDSTVPGVRDLFDEALSYRYETRETDTMIEDVVVRKDDDRVAALEYAIEAMETAAGYSAPLRQSLYGGATAAPRRPMVIGGGA